MGVMASQIPRLAIVYSTVNSCADQRKHQSIASLAFRGIHRWPMNSPHKGPVTRKIFPLDDVIMPVFFNDDAKSGQVMMTSCRRDISPLLTYLWVYIHMWSIIILPNFHQCEALIIFSLLAWINFQINDGLSRLALTWRRSSVLWIIWRFFIIPNPSNILFLGLYSQSLLPHDLVESFSKWEDWREEWFYSSKNLAGVWEIAYQITERWNYLNLRLRDFVIWGKTF